MNHGQYLLDGRVAVFVVLQDIDIQKSQLDRRLGARADAWHKRLVRYYSYFGFQRVRAVGDNGLRDLPDLLVWGGVGMRMVRCPLMRLT